MLRKIIKIDSEKCNGCGLCTTACHEGAIEMVGGKAVLTRENHCDGLGDCLPGCPTGAISFETREAPAYDEAAVLAAKAAKEQPQPCGCPGSAAKRLERPDCVCTGEVPSQLNQWPVQLKLVPTSAPWFAGADVLVAADCTAYAYGNFHRDFIRDHVVLVGCPKLDSVDYSEKLAAIFAGNAVRSVTLTRMMVPCCGGMERAVKLAIAASGKPIPLRVVTIAADGSILSDKRRAKVEKRLFPSGERAAGDTAQLRSRLTGALIGLARATDGNEFRISPSTHQAMLEGLYATDIHTAFTDEALNTLIGRVEQEKAKLSPECLACAAPCGRKDDYDMRQLGNAGEDVRSLKALILLGIRDIAASHAKAPCRQTEEIYPLLYKALFAIGEDWSAEELLPIALEVGGQSLASMAL